MSDQVGNLEIFNKFISNIGNEHFDWEIPFNEDLILHWAELYKLTLINSSSNDFYFSSEVTSNIFNIIHISGKNSDRHSKISAFLFNISTNQVKPIKKSGPFGYIFGTVRPIETVLNVLLRLSIKAESVLEY